MFEVYPGLPGEGRYRRLIEENGKPVPPDSSPGRIASAERRRRVRAKPLERVAAAVGRARAAERRTAQYTAAIDDLFRIYDIRMVRREQIDGHDTILATLTPKPA